MALIHALDVVEIEIDEYPKTAGKEWNAKLLRFVGKHTDNSELTCAAAALAQPVHFEDAIFGVLLLDRSLNWYSCRAPWQGKAIDLNVSMDEAPSESSVLEVAHRLWEQSTAMHPRLLHTAADHLLATKNDGWLDEDEDEISQEAFMAAMDLESVVIYPDGSFEFYFADGDLFWGHTIIVSGSLSEGPTDAQIAG